MFSRGGRGGFRNFDGEQDQNMDETQPELNDNQNIDQFGGERQNLNGEFKFCVTCFDEKIYYTCQVSPTMLDFGTLL